MSMTLQGNLVNFLVQAGIGSTGQYTGGPLARFRKTRNPGGTTTDGDWNLAIVQEYTIAASATESIDLKALPDPEGTDQAYVDVDVFIVEWDAANQDTGSLKPNATNGWTNLLADASDILTLRIGMVSIFMVSGGIPVGASNKVIDIVNNDSSNASVARVWAFGRTA